MASLIFLFLEKCMFLTSGGICTHCLMARARKRLQRLSFHVCYCMFISGWDSNHGWHSWATLFSRGLSGIMIQSHTMIRLFDYHHCFIVFKAKDVELPPPEDGDILAIHDTGAYTMSMYCKWVGHRFSCQRSFIIIYYVCFLFLFVRFNSIRASPVYGYRKVGDDIQFTCFKLRESVEECLQFWGLEQENIIQLWFVGYQ